MGIQISQSTTNVQFTDNNSFKNTPAASFGLMPSYPESLHYKGYSSGSVDSNTELLKGAMRQWADRNGIKLSEKEVTQIAELMASKMHMKNLDPNSAEYRAYRARAKELSRDLLPTAARRIPSLR